MSQVSGLKSNFRKKLWNSFGRAAASATPQLFNSQAELKVRKTRDFQDLSKSNLDSRVLQLLLKSLDNSCLMKFSELINDKSLNVFASFEKSANSSY